MSDDERRSGHHEPVRKGGAAGPQVTVRKRLQAFVLVAFLIILFTAPPSLERRSFIFGTMIVVVVVDLVMLWRRDLDYTHFHSREWSFRVNFVLLALAVGLFVLALTD